MLLVINLFGTKTLRFSLTISGILVFNLFAIVLVTILNKMLHKLIGLNSLA